MFRRLSERYKKTSIQFTLSLSFTMVAVVCMVIMGVLLYNRFVATQKKMLIQENQQLVNQIALNVTSYTRNMREISSSMYYNVIKNTDLSENNMDKEMTLLYEVNKDSLTSIACFSEDGKLIAAVPNSNMKDELTVSDEEWFVKANTIMENLHFSTPHVQNIFEDNNYRYRWVVSLSRVVELNTEGKTSRGVLLVDMNFNRIQQIFTQATGENVGYLYLADSKGEIIYHPKQNLIHSGLFEENNEITPSYSDGHHEEVFKGASRQIVVKTVGYTGWKIISVIPNSEFVMGFQEIRTLVFIVSSFAILLVVLVNSFVSSRIADPIQRLDQSVKDLEKGNLTLDIYTGGPSEVQHLGRTIRSVVEQMRGLMDDIVKEQEAKQKNEFDALQAQINPHFLYNTLDSIVWMIESEQYSEATSMVTTLASLFRISLSKGKTIIPIRRELDHARYYLYIQNIRYKNKFHVVYEFDETILNYDTIKLIVQPLLENAIYHAMELLDGDGQIVLRCYEKEDDIYIEVEDNGLGITPEKLSTLLAGDVVSTRKKGSGIGLHNVHQRIQLYYGSSYGLEIESELDEGTIVRIHLPKIMDDQPFSSGTKEANQ